MLELKKEVLNPCIISQTLYLQKYCISESREAGFEAAGFTNIAEVLIKKATGCWRNVQGLSVLT